MIKFTAKQEQTAGIQLNRSNLTSKQLKETPSRYFQLVKLRTIISL